MVVVGEGGEWWWWIVVAVWVVLVVTPISTMRVVPHLRGERG